MADDPNGRVGRIAANRTSGASEIEQEVVSVLRDALATRAPMGPLASALLRAQPSMAPVWNAVGQALAARHDAALFERYAQQVTRAPRSLLRHARTLLQPEEEPGKSLRLVTISFSGTVLLLLQSLAGAGSLQVACADGQPALEGRRMAERLAAQGIAVTHYTDAALGHALDGADAVLVGADAVTPQWFLNKSGTRMLAAAALQQGVPVHVAATRNKFLSQAVGARLAIREESPVEVWPSPPPGVTVRNPYFEATPLELVTTVITDMGILGAALVPDACPTTNDALLLGLAFDF